MKVSDSSLIYFERNKLYETLPFKRLILNIGCGSGSFPKFYLYKNSFIVNIDIGEEKGGYPAHGLRYKTFNGFLEITKNNWRFLNLKENIFDIYNFPDKLFDMVVCGQIIEHFDLRDIELLLSEIYRILDNDGLFQCDTVTHNYREIQEHRYIFTLDSIQYLFDKFGFEKIQCFEFSDRMAIWSLYKKRLKYGDSR